MTTAEDIKSEELVFEVDGSRISADRFRKGFNAFLDVIDEVTKDISGASRSINWIVSVSAGSLHIHLRPEPGSRRMPPHEILYVLDSIQTGFDVIESGPERPKHFSDSALEKVGVLASVVDGKDRGLDAVRIRRNGHTNRVTSNTMANVNRFFGTANKDWGSVEGRLRMVSAGGGYSFSVYDDVRGKSISCHFPAELVPKVLAAFEKRVCVSGLIRYTGRGDIKSVEVEDFEVFPDPEQLPGFEDIFGLFGGAD